MIGLETSPCDEGVIYGGKAGPACERARQRWVLVAAVLGSSLAFILTSGVNVALPAMQRALSATAPEMQWVVNAYMLFLGALILAGGSAGDRYGRRRVFVIGIALFAVASVWCGLAPSAEQLIAARCVQGLGGALLVPSSLALISASFHGEARGQAIGTWAGFSALTTAFGPALNGWLVDAFSWRAVFFLVVPLAVATLGVALWRVPESREASGAGLDKGGAFLATLGLGGLTYAFITAGGRGWGDVGVLAAMGGGLAALVAFLYVERRHATPMMPLGLFKSRTFSGANAMTFFLYFALGGALFFLPFNLIQVQGYSAAAAGAALLPFSLVMAGLSRWAGSLVARYGAKRPLVVGPIVTAAGFALLLRPSASGAYWSAFFPAFAVLGLGMAISVAPLTTVVMNAVPDDRAGLASGVNNAASRIAGLLAVAVLGALAIDLFADALGPRLQATGAPPEAIQAVYDQRGDLAAAAPPADLAAQTQAHLTGAVHAAYVVSFRWIMGLAAALALLSALCAALFIAPHTEDPP